MVEIDRLAQLISELDEGEIADSARHEFQKLGDVAFDRIVEGISGGTLTSRQIANGLLVLMDMCVMACQNRKREVFDLARKLLTAHESVDVRGACVVVLIGMLKLSECYPSLYDLSGSKQEVLPLLRRATKIGLDVERADYVLAFLNESEGANEK